MKVLKRAHSVNQSFIMHKNASELFLVTGASLLTGESHYVDDQHLELGQPGYLFGNMLLFYLRQSVST